MTTDKPELDRPDLPTLLRAASKRAKWYHTGEANLLLASAEEIERLRRERDVLAGQVEAVEALAAPNGAWKGDKHLRVKVKERGFDVIKSAVLVDDLRQALNADGGAE